MQQKTKPEEEEAAAAPVAATGREERALPSKPSALKDLLEAAGATDEDVDEVSCHSRASLLLPLDACCAVVLQRAWRAFGLTLLCPWTRCSRLTTQGRPRCRYSRSLRRQKRRHRKGCPRY